MVTRYQHIIHPIKKGLFKAPGGKNLRKFSLSQLSLIISGDKATIDVDDWYNNTTYPDQISEKDQVIKWFWTLLKNSDQNFLTSLLKFSTGVSSPPLFGFSSLDPKFAIGILNKNHSHLPEAQTCMNIIYLPRYRSMEELFQKLNFAIYSKSGFELE
ncbi:MAG: hypothetical protein MHPSP_003837 [Paramarteilia canceri]